MKTELILDNDLEEDEIKIYAKNATTGARVLSYIDHFTTDRENVVIKSDEEFIVLKKMEIVSAQIHNKILTIYTKNEEFETYKSLSRLLNDLASNTFVQVSRFEMLNIQLIKRVEPSFSGNLIAIMMNGRKVSISRRFVSVLKERLGI